MITVNHTSDTSFVLSNKWDIWGHFHEERYTVTNLSKVFSHPCLVIEYFTDGRKSCPKVTVKEIDLGHIYAVCKTARRKENKLAKERIAAREKAEEVK